MDPPLSIKTEDSTLALVAATPSLERVDSVASADSEVLVVPEERSAYVKIDSKITNRVNVEQAIARA